MMELRDYQKEIVEKAFLSKGNPLCVLPTGAGKTPCIAALAKKVKDLCGRTLIICHRNILISQASDKLAKMGLDHIFIGDNAVRKRTALSNFSETGEFSIKSILTDDDGNSSVVLASLMSVIKERKNLGNFTQVIFDEAHHAVKRNQWGALIKRLGFPKTIGFTATPGRADGQSLSIKKEGIFDVLVMSEILGNAPERALIDRGFLSSYKAFFPAISDNENFKNLGTEEERISTQSIIISRDEYDEDLKKIGTKEVSISCRSHLARVTTLAGHPVDAYSKYANGTQALVCAPQIKNAEVWENSFNERNISAFCIHSKMSAIEVVRRLKLFKEKKAKVLIHVDMVGEGFDLPSLETVIIANTTSSFSRYRQWCGRMFRPEDGKACGILIDLAGMCDRFGLPDDPVDWNLENPPKCPSEIVMWACKKCGFTCKVTEIRDVCPNCGSHVNFESDNRPRIIKYLKATLQKHVKFQKEEAAMREYERSLCEDMKSPRFSDLGIAKKYVNFAWENIYSKLEARGSSRFAINKAVEGREFDNEAFWTNGLTIFDIKNASNKLLSKMEGKIK